VIGRWGERPLALTPIAADRRHRPIAARSDHRSPAMVILKFLPNII
jgi:hypothetical protein